MYWYKLYDNSSTCTQGACRKFRLFRIELTLPCPSERKLRKLLETEVIAYGGFRTPYPCRAVMFRT
jgi:uncharacterized protein (DUF169 family)